jgi:Spy/CpxP family protein refolding chaperone
MTIQVGSRNTAKVAALAVAAAVWCAAPAVYADPPMPPGHGMGMGMDMDSGHGYGHGHGYEHGYEHGGYEMMPHNAAAHFITMGHALGLTSDEYKKLKDMRDDYIKNNSVAEKQLEADHGDLKWLLHADKFDRDAIDKKLADIGKLESQLWKAYIDQLQAINGMLTDDQKAKLKDMFSHYGGHGHPRMGGGMGPGSGMGMQNGMGK